MMLTLSGSDTPDATVNSPYSHVFAAAGGKPPYRFLITAGVLPPNLTLDPETGTITGTPAGAIFVPRLLRLDSTTKDDEGFAVERVWESGLVRAVNDFAVRMIRVGNLDVWARGNGDLLTQVFGPDKQRRVIPPLLNPGGVPATLSEKPGTMCQEKFDLAHVENWTAQFSTRLAECWFELSEFTGYQKADLSNK